jgi:UDP-glucose 4-epimerase
MENQKTQFSDKTILITGGSGFIGSALALKCSEIFAQVHIIDRVVDTPVVKNNVTYHTMDLSSNEQLSSLLQNLHPHYISHHAANTNISISVSSPEQDAKDNILATINLLQAIKGLNVERFVFASSGGALYNNGNLPYTEETPQEPISPYGLSKLTSEKYIELLCRQSNCPYTILRYSNVYGPSETDSGGVITRFVRQAIQNEALTLYNEGIHIRDFVYIDDVINANLLSLSYNKTGPFNISTGTGTSIADLANMIKIAVHKPDLVVKHSTSPAFELEVSQSILSPEKAKQQLNWVPQTDLSSGIKQMVEYYQQSTSENG